ncbi:MAG: GrpB family protein [Bacilli bacterium]|nr:GrpB family protein [Bacilli bacterium]
MKKKLSEMTIEELWHLFPIYLTEHKKEWQEDFEEAKNHLNKIINKEHNVRISHIGSTAIKGIWAKPIIDILIEVKDNVELTEMAEILEINGYICMSITNHRISLNKGYTEDGFSDKVYHVHLRYFGDNDELYFRDYLNEFSSIAKEYEALKLELWRKYEYNRDAYTNAKGQFVEQYSKEARAKYKDRYL